MTDEEILKDFFTNDGGCENDVWEDADNPDIEGFLPCYKCTLKLMAQARAEGKMEGIQLFVHEIKYCNFDDKTVEQLQDAVKRAIDKVK